MFGLFEFPLAGATTTAGGEALPDEGELPAGADPWDVPVLPDELDELELSDEGGAGFEDWEEPELDDDEGLVVVCGEAVGTGLVAGGAAVAVAGAGGTATEGGLLEPKGGMLEESNQPIRILSAHSCKGTGRPNSHTPVSSHNLPTTFGHKIQSPWSSTTGNIIVGNQRPLPRLRHPCHSPPLCRRPTICIIDPTCSRPPPVNDGVITSLLAGGLEGVGTWKPCQYVAPDKGK